MSNKLSKLLITIITLLTVSLVATYLNTKIDSFYKGHNKFLNVWLGMLVIVCVYYPMTIFLDQYFLSVSRKLVNKSKKISTNNVFGMLIGFSISILVLYMAYAYLWYGINVPVHYWGKLK